MPKKRYDWKTGLLALIAIPLMMIALVINCGEWSAEQRHIKPQPPVQAVITSTRVDSAEDQKTVQQSASPSQPPRRPRTKPVKEHSVQACDEPDPSTAPPNSDWDDGNTDPGCPESDDLIITKPEPEPRRIIGPLP